MNNNMKNNNNWVTWTFSKRKSYGTKDIRISWQLSFLWATWWEFYQSTYFHVRVERILLSADNMILRTIRDHSLIFHLTNGAPNIWPSHDWTCGYRDTGQVHFSLCYQGRLIGKWFPSKSWIILMRKIIQKSRGLTRYNVAVVLTPHLALSWWRPLITFVEQYI